MTCKEKAVEWSLSIRSVNSLCKQGKIKGAMKVKGIWKIPDDAENQLMVASPLANILHLWSLKFSRLFQ